MEFYFRSKRHRKNDDPPLIDEWSHVFNILTSAVSFVCYHDKMLAGGKFENNRVMYDARSVQLQRREIYILFYSGRSSKHV